MAAATPGHKAARERAPQGPAAAVRPPREAARAPALPKGVLGYVLETSRLHQLCLVVLTVAAFLLELVPLELQRRIVNDLTKERHFHPVVILCAVYAGVILVQGSTKLALNVYRAWVGERATRDLRSRIRLLVGAGLADRSQVEASGIEVSMIVAETDPIGGFVGESISEPLLQGGVLATMLAYMIHIEPVMALVAGAFYLPQLVFVPLMQSAINRRTAARVWLLRQISVNVVTDDGRDARRRRADRGRIDRVFDLNMGIFRFKFTMNFLMNLCNHLEIVAALLVGGWFVLTGRLALGSVIAFISAVARLNDPWGDLINYFRDVTSTQVKYRLVADVVNRLALGKAAETPSV